MKLRLAAILLLLFGGMVMWLTTTRTPTIVRSSEPPSSLLAEQASQKATNDALTDPEGNPEVPEETAAASEPALPGPVIPLPKPVSLAAREEPAPGTDPEPTEEVTPGLPAITALENVRTAFRQYCLRLGGNPVGGNSEITAALNGQNPRQVVFLSADDGAQVNGRGELVDHWQSPYFFHQLSRTEMEIRSAGPDRKMWTSDDLVLK
jgi:hypothetical protein